MKRNGYATMGLPPWGFWEKTQRFITIRRPRDMFQLKKVKYIINNT